MQIKKTIERVPGGLMVVPLFLGAVLNTIDKLHLPPIMDALRWLGVSPVDAKGNMIRDLTAVAPEAVFYEFFYVGGFATPLFKTGALTLIGLFLVCVGSQMNFRVGGRSLKKGLVITLTKFAVAMAVGYTLGYLAGDRYDGFLGLSVMAIIAAMSNGNGGLYAALTGQYGNRSDVGAISVISLNDGPFLTMIALGILGESFPAAAFIGVLVPMLLGFILGQLDPDMRKFLAAGEVLVIPFFAFALGAAYMNLADFLRADVLLAGLLLAVLTVVVGGLSMAAMLRLFGERSQTGGVAEASTAGNAGGTPAAIALVAGGTGGEAYRSIVATAQAQISISTITTALLCPLAVILWDRWQRSRGIDGKLEHPGRGGAYAEADAPRPPLDAELERAYEHSPTDVPVKRRE